jgi:uncharacterized membrane protein
MAVLPLMVVAVMLVADLAAGTTLTVTASTRSSGGGAITGEAYSCIACNAYGAPCLVAFLRLSLMALAGGWEYANCDC